MRNAGEIGVTMDGRCTSKFVGFDISTNITGAATLYLSGYPK
jgi:hypothetical protein